MDVQEADYDSSSFNQSSYSSTSEITSSSCASECEASSRLSLWSVLDDSLAIGRKLSGSFATCPGDQLLHSGAKHAGMESRHGCYRWKSSVHTYPLTSTPELLPHHGTVTNRARMHSENMHSDFTTAFKNQSLFEPSVINNSSNVQEFKSSSLESSAFSNSTLSVSMPVEMLSESDDVKSGPASSNGSYLSGDSPCYNAHVGDKRNSRYWQLKNPSGEEICKIKRIAALLSTSASPSRASSTEGTDSKIEMQCHRHNSCDSSTSFRGTKPMLIREENSPDAYKHSLLDPHVVNQRLDPGNSNLTGHGMREVRPQANRTDSIQSNISQTTERNNRTPRPQLCQMPIHEVSPSKASHSSISDFQSVFSTRSQLSAMPPKTRQITDRTTMPMEVDLSPDLNMLASCRFKFPALTTENEFRLSNSGMPQCKRKLSFSASEWLPKRARHCADQRSYENGVHPRRELCPELEHTSCSVYKRDRQLCGRSTLRDTHFSSEDEEAVFYLVAKYLRDS